MKKLLISCIVLTASLQIASAQDRSDIKAEIKEQRNALIMERQNQTSPKIGLSVTAASRANRPAEPAGLPQPPLAAAVAARAQRRQPRQ